VRVRIVKKPRSSSRSVIFVRSAFLSPVAWIGWRGSREEQISELLVLAHAIEATTAEAGLAFYRLNDNTNALNKMSFTCSSP
jgi:hypothetical protein